MKRFGQINGITPQGRTDKMSWKGGSILGRTSKSDGKATKCNLTDTAKR